MLLRTFRMQNDRIPFSEIYSLFSPSQPAVQNKGKASHSKLSFLARALRLISFTSFSIKMQSFILIFSELSPIPLQYHNISLIENTLRKWVAINLTEVLVGKQNTLGKKI